MTITDLSFCRVPEPLVHAWLASLCMATGSNTLARGYVNLLECWLVAECGLGESPS